MPDFQLAHVNKIKDVSPGEADQYLDQGWRLLGVQKSVWPSGFGTAVHERITLVIGWPRDEEPPDSWDWLEKASDATK